MVPQLHGPRVGQGRILGDACENVYEWAREDQRKVSANPQQRVNPLGFRYLPSRSCQSVRASMHACC